MAGMGPPPKAPGTRQRRNASPQVTSLPTAGRRGKLPPWPLPDDIAKRVMLRMASEKLESLRVDLDLCEDSRTRKRLESEVEAVALQVAITEAEIEATRTGEASLWAELWSTPQAVMWEQLCWAREVAQYVRWKVRGELGDMDAAKEARQWSDRLGLNPLALLRLRWEIERSEEAVDKGKRRRAAAATPRKTTSGDPRTALRAV